MSPPFDVFDFAFKKIAVRPETEEERDEFIQNMRDFYPQYMKSWSNVPYDLDSCYIVGYRGADRLQMASNAAGAKSVGYDVISYQDLCGACVNYDAIAPVSSLL